MTGLLDGRIAVVTGGGSGIGRAIAQGYAKEGAQIAVLDINGDAAAQTAKSITTAGGKATSTAATSTAAMMSPLILKSIRRPSFVLSKGGRPDRSPRYR
jgi:NAD(P)-dependent dehydrogenase (short-subunit alcohol dehydrogenase family)